MALSQNHYSDAAAFARKAIATDTGQNARTNSELIRTLGLSLLRSGKQTEGLRLCRKSLDLAATLDDPLEVLDARLALIEALLTTGDRVGALRVFHDSEPVLAHYPASRWRGLALIRRADHQYDAAARDALDAVRHAWGEEAFEVYLSRPDWSRLARPLFQKVPASLK